MQTTRVLIGVARRHRLCVSRQRRTIVLRWCLLLALTALCGGCSETDGLVSVSGVVTLDGKPLDKARILFRKVQADQRAFGGFIENGEYMLRTEPGPMTVQISAWRPNGKVLKEGDSEIPLSDQYLPAKYNVETELTAEVGTSPNDIPFHLTSK